MIEKINLKKYIAIFVILIIPFFYVFFFLKAFWNPYEKLDTVPVAIVNLDKGNIGAEIVKKLKDSKKMKVEEVSSDEIALNGVKDRIYYSSITIPENFSDNITSLQKNEIIYRSNKKFNYIASQLYERAAIEIQNTVKNTISNQIEGKLHDSIKESASKIDELSNGLSKINDGSKQLEEGLLQLQKGVNKFNVDGVNQIKGGVQQYVDGVDKATDGLDQISGGVIKLGDTLKILKINSNFKKLYNGAKEVQNTNVKEKLTRGGYELNKGVDNLESASREIQKGVNKIYEGSKKLNSGITTANNSVKNSVKESKIKLEKIGNIDEFVQNSVNLKVENIDNVNNYGTIFATYFISISLWVGNLTIVITLFYDRDRRFGIFDKENTGIKQYLAYICLSIIQTFLLSFLILSTFNFDKLNLPIFLIGMLSVNLVFFNIIYFMNRISSDVGRFLSMILLIIQISASAGTFPIETSPNTFIKIFPYVPMRYTINLFKEGLAGYDHNFFIFNIQRVGGMLIVAVIFNLLLFVYDNLKNRKNITN